MDIEAKSVDKLIYKALIYGTSSMKTYSDVWGSDFVDLPPGEKWESRWINLFELTAWWPGWNKKPVDEPEKEVKPPWTLNKGEPGAVDKVPKVLIEWLKEAKAAIRRSYRGN